LFLTVLRSEGADVSQQCPKRRLTAASLRGTRRAALTAAAVIAAPIVLLGCSDDEGGAPTLTWYINPDNGGQAELAAKCGEASGGAFRVETQILPNEADAQREQLVRRLAADDPSIDLMSLDPPFVAEFANAGYLLPITNQDDVTLFTEGVLDGPLATAYWDDQLVAPPFWANTQLLWFRKSVAKAAGVDPTAADFTWDEMIEAAESQSKRIGVQGRRYEGYMVWINALVSSGGGQIIENAELGADATPTVASPAGDAAAEIVGTLARSSAAPADMSTAGEEEARTLFQGENGSFMVNWPYVYQAAREAVSGGGLDQSVVDDIGWARYPGVSAGTPSTPPLGGINLAIGNFTKYPAEALAAAKCITSLESGIQYMLKTGNPAARAAAYDDPGVREAFPMADLIRESINDAGPRPITPYYGDVSTSVQRTWHPPEGVQSPSTPESTDDYMTDVLAGERLL
jgi:multiple sugar transport system substrate-binding protein